MEEKKQTEKMKVKRQKGRGTRLETELEKQTAEIRGRNQLEKTHD